MPSLLRSLTPLGWAAALLTTIFVIVLSWIAGTTPGRERALADAAIARANTSIRDRDSAAREVAADTRLADAAATTAMKTELAHALENLPDSAPSDRRVALACARLRGQGADTAAIPACQRPQGGG